MREPTALYKAKLIETIMGVVCGEIETERNNRGAPIKNMHVEVHLVEVIEELKKKSLYSAVAEET